MFLTEAHFKTIAANINRYADIKKAGSKGKRVWWPTSAAEIKVFIATFIYIGVARLPPYEDYWNSKYGQFVYAQHISLNRFEDLKRYMHISNPKPNASLNKSREDNSKDDSKDETLEESA